VIIVAWIILHNGVLVEPLARLHEVNCSGSRHKPLTYTFEALAGRRDGSNMYPAAIDSIEGLLGSWVFGRSFVSIFFLRRLTLEFGKDMLGNGFAMVGDFGY